MNPPDIALGMVRFLVSEVTRIRTQITDMSFKDARMKIATLLLSLVTSETATPPRPYSFQLPFSRQEISEILELSPETVSRTLSSMRHEQMLDAHGRRVTIQDIDRLRTAAQR